MQYILHHSSTINQSHPSTSNPSSLSHQILNQNNENHAQKTQENLQHLPYLEKPSLSLASHATTRRRATMPEARSIGFLGGPLHHEPKGDQEDLRGLQDDQVPLGEFQGCVFGEGRVDAHGVSGGALGDPRRQGGPPRLFVRGKYVGGADEVVRLHDNGMLRAMLQGIPLAPSARPCGACGGMTFLLCGTCNGSKKVNVANGARARCPDCNENGLVKCTLCHVG